METLFFSPPLNKSKLFSIFLLLLLKYFLCKVWHISWFLRFGKETLGGATTPYYTIGHKSSQLRPDEGIWRCNLFSNSQLSRRNKSEFARYSTGTAPPPHLTRFLHILCKIQVLRAINVCRQIVLFACSLCRRDCSKWVLSVGMMWKGEQAHSKDQ